MPARWGACLRVQCIYIHTIKNMHVDACMQWCTYVYTWTYIYMEDCHDDEVMHVRIILIDDAIFDCQLITNNCIIRVIDWLQRSSMTDASSAMHIYLLGSNKLEIIMLAMPCVHLQMSLPTHDSFSLCIDYFEETFPVRPNDLFIYLVCLLLQLRACILLKWAAG